MDRIDVLLRADIGPSGPVLTEVWYRYFKRGEQLQCLQLRRELADPAWSKWERTLFETATRAQLSLFD